MHTPCAWAHVVAISTAVCTLYTSSFCYRFQHILPRPIHDESLPNVVVLMHVPMFINTQVKCVHSRFLCLFPSFTDTLPIWYCDWHLDASTLLRHTVQLKFSARIARMSLLVASDMSSCIPEFLTCAHHIEACITQKQGRHVERATAIES